jgi:hypothetical protein
LAGAGVVLSLPLLEAMTRSRTAQAEARAAGEIIEDDGETFTKVVAYLENLKVI